ncbi:MAG: polyprenyl synthetase family protein [Bacteroidales bacterium]|nr:polyprenyl synthetase family protein [Bacteroidales bacterium]
MTLDEIKAPVRTEMSDFEPFFKQQLKSPYKLLSVVTNYILRRKGKQMRPLLVFLAAKATGAISPRTYTAATLIELLHTATLVHDDVVDETYQRRGQFSVNAIWNSKVSVLVGDFFLARGMQVALDGDHYDVLKIVSKAVSEISEGELVQIDHARRLDIEEETYFEIIRKKTATLIAACTQAGAYSATSDNTLIEALYQYGVNLGIAFQIRDDIFDFEDTGLFGKPSGNDIRERKITLPLIYALGQAPAKEKREMMSLIGSHYKEDSTIERALVFTQKNGGIEYARNRMHDFSLKAKEALSAVADSDAKQSLLQLVDFNEQRKK